MPSSRRVLLSLEAEDDLRQIAEYTIEHWGEEQADEYIDEIKLSLQSLERFPDRGHDYPLISGLRWFPVRHYDVFYRETGAHLEIVRIIHQRRNIAAQLRNPG